MSGLTKVGTGAKLEDSNMEHYGSKEHKDLKRAAARTEKAWEGAGEEVGVEVWRIEKFKVVRQDKKTYGSFFRGDSYIVLNTYKPDPEKEALAYNVHFWLGKESTLDEMGTAAYKTVELDDYLGSLPVQFREVDGLESPEFLACFNGQITVLEGGIESGFNHVKPTEYKPRLFHLKGKKEIRVQEVKLQLSSLNKGDAYLLDMGMEIIQWNGPYAGTHEKLKGRELIQSLQADRNGKPQSRVLDGIEADALFWKTLGQETEPKSLNELSEETSDENIHLEIHREMYEVSDRTGRLLRTPVTFSKASLKSDEVFLVDVGTCVYCWVGKGASKTERQTALKIADDFLKETGMDAHTPIVRVLENHEPESFKKALSKLSLVSCPKFTGPSDRCSTCKKKKSLHTAQALGEEGSLPMRQSVVLDISHLQFADCEKYEIPAFGSLCKACQKPVDKHSPDAQKAGGVVGGKITTKKEETMEDRKQRLSVMAANKKAEAAKKKKEKEEAEAARAAEEALKAKKKAKMDKFLSQVK